MCVIVIYRFLSGVVGISVSERGEVRVRILKLVHAIRLIMFTQQKMSSYAVFFARVQLNNSI